MSANSVNPLQTEAEKQDIIRIRVKTRQAAYRQRKLGDGYKATLVRITERAYIKLNAIKSQRNMPNLSITLSHCIDSRADKENIFIPHIATDPVGSREIPFFLTAKQAAVVRGLPKWWQLSAMIECEHDQRGAAAARGLPKLWQLSTMIECEHDQCGM